MRRPRTAASLLPTSAGCSVPSCRPTCCLPAGWRCRRFRRTPPARSTGAPSANCSTPMKLLSPDHPDWLMLVAGWLARKENYQWLDFGDGHQMVDARWLKIAMQRGTHVLRIFTSDEDGTPIGVVGLSNVNRHFKTATLWVVLGEKSYAGQGYATRAVSEMLTAAFEELGLHTVNTWIVDRNPSIR